MEITPQTRVHDYRNETELQFAPCDGVRIRSPRKFCMWNLESWKFLLVESGIMGLEIRNTARRSWNPESKFH